MKETLGRGEKIKISGFGNFVLRDKRQRQGRNPQTGEPITITERRSVELQSQSVVVGSAQRRRQRRRAVGRRRSPTICKGLIVPEADPQLPVKLYYRIGEVSTSSRGAARAPLLGNRVSFDSSPEVAQGPAHLLAPRRRQAAESQRAPVLAWVHDRRCAQAPTRRWRRARANAGCPPGGRSARARKLRSALGEIRRDIVALLAEFESSGLEVSNRSQGATPADPADSTAVGRILSCVGLTRRWHAFTCHPLPFSWRSPDGRRSESRHVARNLGADPELKMTSGGQAVLKLRLATSETYLRPEQGASRAYGVAQRRGLGQAGRSAREVPDQGFAPIHRGWPTHVELRRQRRQQALPNRDRGQQHHPIRWRWSRWGGWWRWRLQRRFWRPVWRRWRRSGWGYSVRWRWCSVRWRWCSVRWRRLRRPRLRRRWRRRHPVLSGCVPRWS